jgi:4-oxalocrotonate tautomerase
MPHVIVKLWPGKSDNQKSRLVDAITRDVTDVLDYGDDAVSILFDEVAPNDWSERVHKPDILGRWNDLAKQPGYDARPSDQRHHS